MKVWDLENDAFIRSEHNYFPLIPMIGRRDTFERKSLNHWPRHSANDMQSVSKSKQGGAARQNKFKTILYCLIVFFGFYY